MFGKKIPLNKFKKFLVAKLKKCDFFNKFMKDKKNHN